MNDIVNIKCARIQSELTRYYNTGIIPHDLLDGSYSIDDVTECLPHLSETDHLIANQLILAYTENMQANLSELKIELRREYATVVSNFKTASADFQFPTVLHRYRKNINPVTALYYEARELIRRYNMDNPRHEWLLGLLQDREFNNQIISALMLDVARLERIIRRYYWPINKYSDDISLELFHARQLSTDFKHYITLFDSILEWDPNC